MAGVRGFVGKMYLELGSGSPETFTRLCELTGLSGLGQANELIDDTDFCSDGVREYIGGLADGQEVTMNLKFKQAADNAIRTLIQSVKDKATLQYRLVIEELGPDQILLMNFHALSLSWTLNPSFTERNTIDFGVKISGDIGLVDVNA
jgi:hypothetical protein